MVTCSTGKCVSYTYTYAHSLDSIPILCLLLSTTPQTPNASSMRAGIYLFCSLLYSSTQNSAWNTVGAQRILLTPSFILPKFLECWFCAHTVLWARVRVIIRHPGTPLAVQCLELCASTAGGMGSIAGRGTKTPQATRPGPKINN